MHFFVSIILSCLIIQVLINLLELMKLLCSPPYQQQEGFSPQLIVNELS
jgi:hypothetical protein